MLSLYLLTLAPQDLFVPFYMLIPILLEEK